MLQTSVSIYEDTSNHKYNKPQYGVSYTFGGEYTAEDLKRLNDLCDTIVFREHYSQMLGMYPDFKIHFTRPNITEHNVLFRDCPIGVVRRAANQIAKYLNVDVTESLVAPKILLLGGGY